MTIRVRDARPEPTVRPPRARAAARLGLAGVLPLLAGVCGAAIGVALHRYALAITAAALGCAAAVPFLLTALVIQARAMRVNPWPALLAADLLTALASLRVLPAVGQSWARVPLLALCALLAWKTGRAAVRHRRRTAGYRRLAQALSPVLAQGAGQHEQVLAGLAGTARAERVTAPHYGAAPNAAWNLRITRWRHDQVDAFVLQLPAHDDITTPEFLARIKDAVQRKLGVRIRLHVAPQRDEISGEVTDGSEEPETQATPRELAIERITVAAGMLLKGVHVEHLDMNQGAGDPAPDGIAGAGHAVREFTISYEPARVVTHPGNRFNITAHMSTQLFGEPDRLRATWHVDQDKVTFRRRREFPFLIPAPVLTTEQLRQMFGDRVVLAWGEDEDSEMLGYALSKTTLPHGGVIGPTGGGKTQLLLLLAMRAAYLGVEVWGCDPKMIELMGLRGWPNVTRVATRILDMIKTVGDAHTLMYERIDDVQAGRKRRQDLRRLLVIIDEFFVFRMLVSAWWAANRKKEDPKEHPVFRQLAELLALSRSLNINIVIGIQRPDAVFFAEGSRDNIGWWVSLGSLSPQGAQMVWQDTHIGTDLPADEPGLCTATGPKGPVRAKVHYVPNPADALTGDGLSDADMAFLRSMLPPHTTWDGPLPAEAPDPGFEASAAAGSAIETDPVGGFLLLLQLALTSRTAHLTAAAGGGAPASGDLGGRYGWGPGPGGQSEPGGTWIGAVEDTPAGRRVYLHPQRAHQVAAAYAAELDEPFMTRPELDAVIRNSGLLQTEGGSDGIRYTVRRALPGNDLGGDDRVRVWDIPEDALIAPPGGPGAADPRLPGPGAGEPAGPARAAIPLPAAAVSRFRRAADLADGDRIILDFEGGEQLAATVFGAPEPDPTATANPEPDGTPRLIIVYFLGQGEEMGRVQARADHPIRLEPPGPAEGSQP